MAGETQWVMRRAPRMRMFTTNGPHEHVGGSVVASEASIFYRTDFFLSSKPQLNVQFDKSMVLTESG